MSCLRDESVLQQAMLLAAPRTRCRGSIGSACGVGIGIERHIGGGDAPFVARARACGDLLDLTRCGIKKRGEKWMPLIFHLHVIPFKGQAQYTGQVRRTGGGARAIAKQRRPLPRAVLIGRTDAAVCSITQMVVQRPPL